MHDNVSKLLKSADEFNLVTIASEEEDVEFIYQQTVTELKESVFGTTVQQEETEGIEEDDAIFDGFSDSTLEAKMPLDRILENPVAFLFLENTRS